MGKPYFHYGVTGTQRQTTFFSVYLYYSKWKQIQRKGSEVIIFPGTEQKRRKTNAQEISLILLLAGDNNTKQH